MNNREAITLLRNLEDSLDSYCELNEEGKTAFRMAIEALSCSEFPNSSDTIYRQAAIDALADMHCKSDEDGYVWIIRSDAWARIDALPSAQPERLTDYSFEESCTECPAYDTENHRCPRFNQVIRTALKDANLEPCEDYISRQAAIDALERDIKFVEEEREKAITRPEKYHDRFVEASTQQIMGMAHALQAIEELPSAQPEYRLDEWCTDCKEYDTERHCCPRFNQVIRTTLNEMKSERKTGKWKVHLYKFGRDRYECSECTGRCDLEYDFCPNCGARMTEEDV